MSVSKEINSCFSNLDIFKKVDNIKLNELLDLYTQNFNSIYVEKIYHIIIHSNNINKLYDFIKKYVIMNKKKIVDCVKKNRFSIDELQNFINKIKHKFIFIKNIDKNFNNNINKIIFNQLIINPNICMLIYKNIINNNIKFIYYLQKIINSNSNSINLLFFMNSFIKYIIEDVKHKINNTNNILNNYKLVYYYIENNFYNFNIYSRLFNNINFKKYIYSEILNKYNTELNNSDYIFILNNILFLNDIIKKSNNMEKVIILKKKILDYTFGNINFYNIPITDFYQFFINVTENIISNDKNFKLNMISIFQKNNKLLEKFINYIVVKIYELMKYNNNITITIKNTQYINILLKNISMLLDYNELFKIKFMNVFKNINNTYLLDKIVKKNYIYNLSNEIKNILLNNKDILSEYLYNIYTDYAQSIKNCITINPYYWSINNNNNYIYNNSMFNSDKYNYLEYLHFGKTTINFEYNDNMINLTMLPIQYEMFKYFNENNIFPNKIGNYSKDYLNKVILSLVNSKLILCNNNIYSINSNFKQIYKNMIEVFYTNKCSKVKNIKRENAIDIKYVLATNINKYLKSRENNLDNIYNYLIKTLNIELFNINKKNISDTLDYMIKQEYISKDDNMYMKLF